MNTIFFVKNNELHFGEIFMKINELSNSTEAFNFWSYFGCKMYIN